MAENEPALGRADGNAFQRGLGNEPSRLRRPVGQPIRDRFITPDKILATPPQTSTR